MTKPSGSRTRISRAWWIVNAAVLVALLIYALR